MFPGPQICWYLAAVVQVQLCKYFIEIGDSEREATVWGEINVLRFAVPVLPILHDSSVSQICNARIWKQIAHRKSVVIRWCIVFR
jgi:hypothetical protein